MEATQEDLFCWSEKYHVGIAFADVQHKQLVDIINRLHQVLMEGKGRVVIGKTLDELIRYTTDPEMFGFGQAKVPTKQL